MVLKQLEQQILKLFYLIKPNVIFVGQSIFYKKFKKTLTRLNTNSISFNKLFNTLMFLQPYEINNILMIK